MESRVREVLQNSSMALDSPKLPRLQSTIPVRSAHVRVKGYLKVHGTS